MNHDAATFHHTRSICWQKVIRDFLGELCNKEMEPPRGFEPRTYALRVRCSTTELRRRAHEEPAHVTGRPDSPLLADQISRRERSVEQKGVDSSVNALRALVISRVVMAIPTEKVCIAQLFGHLLPPLIRGRWIMLG